jgi:CRISPR/Cas system-associated exonuclease Cas4 (RecB family)
MDEENSELYDINIPKFIYNKLNQISEIYLKYISSYKSSTKDYIKDLKSIHKTYHEKMKEIKSECEKNKYFDLSLFFTILNSIPNINSSFVESLQFMINELEILVEKIQNGMKEKKIIYNKFLKDE